MTNQQQEREARERLLDKAEQETRGRTHDGSDAGTAHWWVRVRYDDLIAALSAAERAAAAVPAAAREWRLVPVEPTEGMASAGGLAILDGAGDPDMLAVVTQEARQCWSAMLAAASQPEPEHAFMGAAGLRVMDEPEHVTSAAGLRVDEGGAIVSLVEALKAAETRLADNNKAAMRRCADPDASAEMRAENVGQNVMLHEAIKIVRAHFKVGTGEV